MEKRHSLSTRSGAARFRSGEGKDRWFQPGGHLGGCVAHGGVRAAAETLQQLAHRALHPLPGDFRNGLWRGRRAHQGRNAAQPDMRQLTFTARAFFFSPRIFCGSPSPMISPAAFAMLLDDLIRDTGSRGWK